jgi:hypothetical protein
MNNKIKSLGGVPLAEKMRQVKKELESAGINDNPSESEENKVVAPKVAFKIEMEDQKTDYKLFVNGRLDRKKHTYIAKPLFLFSGLDEEIKLHCRGAEVAILNYLIKFALDAVKKLEKPLTVDIADVEKGR